jgi:hypothetical protein
MPHRRAVATANAAADAICALCDGGSIRIYSGAQPATPDDEPVGVLLAEPRFGTPAFSAAVDGTATANAITPDGNANATGTAAWYRLCAADGSAVTDDECGVTGSGAALELSTIGIQAGDRVLVPNFSHTEPRT